MNEPKLEEKIQQNTSEPHKESSSEEQEISPEETELQETINRYARYPKLSKWMQLFLDKDNTKTFGNGTESAMQAYDCKDRASASVIGVQNLRKIKGLASAFADLKGMTFGALMTKAYQSALSSDRPEWWDRVMQVTGYMDAKGASISIQNNVQNNIEINEEDAKDFSEAFKRFLEKE